MQFLVSWRVYNNIQNQIFKLKQLLSTHKDISKLNPFQNIKNGHIKTKKENNIVIAIPIILHIFELIKK